MGKQRKWTLEAVKAEASKYKTRQSFRKSSPKAYWAAAVYGWLDNIGLQKDSQILWTDEALFNVASNFETISDFRKAHAGAYETARLRGLLGLLGIKSKFPGHTPGCRMNAPYIWTLEAVKSEAAKYNSRRDFHRGSGSAYMSARRYGWLEKINLPAKKATWTLESVKAEANKFRSRGAFAAGSRSAYNKARLKDWLDELFPR